jgi:hypothetical protein
MASRDRLKDFKRAALNAGGFDALDWLRLTAFPHYYVDTDSITPFAWWRRIPPPVCAVCGKPVDELAAERDVARRSTFVRVRCHGQIEEVEVTDECLEVMGSSIRFGKAFAGAPMLPMKGG